MGEIRGTDDDDVLSGKRDENNVILGLGGNDTLTGGYKADSLDGGEGDDLLLGGSGVGSVLIGGLGDDTLVSYSDQLQGFATYNRLDGGDGDDRIVGWSHDTLIGGAGNDTIEIAYGFQGSNSIQAGSGDDFIYIDPANCTIDGGAGIDRLRTYGELNAASVANVEILEVDGYVNAPGKVLEEFSVIRSVKPGAVVGLSVSEGVDIHSQLGNTSVFLRSSTAGGQTIIVGEGDDSIESFSGDDRIEGRGGDDTILGSNGNSTLLGGAGDDEIFSVGERVSIDGGVGDDVVHINATVQSAFLNGGDGRNTLVAGGDISKALITGFQELRVERSITATAAQLEDFSSISASSTDGFINIILSESGQVDLADELGSRRASIIGSAGGDSIVCGAGDDVIDAIGGSDTVHGGAGSDRLIVSAGSDQLFGDDGNDVFELARKGNSTIDGGSGQDELIVMGDRERPIVDLSVSDIVDVEALAIRGGVVRATAEQFESFDSIANAGPDVLKPVILELAQAGNLDLSDELRALSADVLGTKANDAIRTGDGDDRIVGADGDDRLNGSGGDDVLLGDTREFGILGADTLNGGSGEDTLKGGGGDDVYIVDNVRDKVFEFPSDGNDIVKASVDHELRSGVENLRLATSADLVGTGNELENQIWGNRGDNDIDGLRGSDKLSGGQGDDLFMFTSRLAKSNVDEILDFGKGDDQIGIARDIFSGLPKGAFKESAFKDLATGDVDGNDRIIYDSATGELYFDKDGSGEGKAVLFAELKGSPALSWEDFLII